MLRNGEPPHFITHHWQYRRGIGRFQHIRYQQVAYIQPANLFPARCLDRRATSTSKRLVTSTWSISKITDYIGSLFTMPESNKEEEEGEADRSLMKMRSFSSLLSALPILEDKAVTEISSGSEVGSYLRLLDFCITDLWVWE